jgi:hypothetical protein
LAITFINLCSIFKWRYSIIMFIYWMFISLANTITLRTRIMQQFEHFIITKKNTSSYDSLLPSNNKNPKPINNIEIYIFYVYYGLILSNLILSTFSEKYLDENLMLKTEPIQLRVNLISNLTFWWTNSLIRTGFKRTLTRDDLYEIEQNHKSELITNKMYKEWSLKTSIYFNKSKANEEYDFSARKKTIYNSNIPEEKIELNRIKQTGADKFLDTKVKKKIKKVSEPSLTVCLMKIFGIQFLGIVSIKISHDILSFARPILLDKLINFIKDKEQKNYVGYFYIFVLCLASFTQTLIMQHYQQGVFLIGQQIKIGLQNLIYRKSLSLSATARKETTVGEMVILNENTQFRKTITVKTRKQRHGVKTKKHFYTVLKITFMATFRRGGGGG